MRRLPPTEKRRIRSETEILRELQHPHIIDFYHV
jgi:serine/threonine protein kinase